ncbi:organic cation transporter-like protein [Portunus trituberculatus]|uniref:organic cation transporter-like protein n=1 Tax=Portunus trituberculatus TaxID=210409 RepID=UPI001E1D01E5|nr:organic cation transporter-like protein [Portunus trituberculatus]
MPSSSTLGTGRWTMLYLITMPFFSIFMAPHSLGGAFWAPRLNYSCRVPDKYFSSTNFSFLDSEANTSHSIALRDQCQYRIDTQEGDVIEDCVQFDFDNSTFSSTITSEYNLVCDRAYLQTSFQSMYMLGYFVGSPFCGYLADKYGRKHLVLTGYIAYIVLGLGSAWVSQLSIIFAARFLLGCLHFTNSYTTYVLLMEILEPKLRAPVGFMECNTWAVGIMLYGGLAYWIRDWRLLQTAATLPGLFILPVLWMIDESPRWLLVNGRHEEALQVFNKVSRWHGVKLPSDVAMEKLIEEQDSSTQETHQQSSVRLFLRSLAEGAFVLIRTPLLRIITTCMYLAFLMQGMVYYGLSLSGANISNDPFLYMVLCGLIEIPAYTLIVPVVQGLGRKLSLCSLYVITAGALFTLAVIPIAEYSTTVLILAVFGKMATSSSFQTVVFYASELYPTEIRTRGISTSAMVSRIGSMAAPFINDMVGPAYPWAPFVIFGLGSLLAAAVTLLLPETRGHTLPDTVADLEARVRQTPRKEVSDTRASVDSV